ncbi:MAG TPA: RsmE family RNA methyltransferase [Acidisarcina sp.]
MTRRRWIADTWTESTASLLGDQSLHLARVLRAEPGMEFDVVAGGWVWRAMIASVSEAEVRFNLIAQVESDAALPVTLLLSVFKFDRMEWAIEKVTELGVQAIVPVIARRTEKHLAQAAGKRVERWRRIVREAAQQSRRSDMPEVADAMPLAKALQYGAASGQEPQSILNILLSEQEQSVTLRSVIEQAAHPSKAAGPGVTDATSDTTCQAVRLAIGPEGGWSPEEISLFETEQWKPVTLGPRVLRAETAAITAVAVVSAWLG